MTSLETTPTLLTVITKKWMICDTQRDWADLQCWLDGVYYVCAMMGEKALCDELTLLLDTAHERQWGG